MRMSMVFAAALAAATLCGCAATAVSPEARAHDGVSLYNEVCSSCHGKLDKTTKPGRRAARIRSAIKHNVGGMGFLEGRLEEDEIEAIALALTMVRPPKDATGEELYGLYCAGCHGAYDESDVSGSTLEEIKAAVATKMCNAVYLGFLGEDELAKIADDLAEEEDDEGEAE